MQPTLKVMSLTAVRRCPWLLVIPESQAVAGAMTWQVTGGLTVAAPAGYVTAKPGERLSSAIARCGAVELRVGGLDVLFALSPTVRRELVVACPAREPASRRRKGPLARVTVSAADLTIVLDLADPQSAALWRHLLISSGKPSSAPAHRASAAIRSLLRCGPLRSEPGERR